MVLLCRRVALAVRMATLVVLGMMMPPRQLLSQRVLSTVDVSGIGVSYADTLYAGGVSVSPALRVDWSRATLNAFADLSRMQRAGASLEAGLSPSIFTPSAGIFSGEVAGSLGGSADQDGTRTGQISGLLRGYAIVSNAGGWLSAGGGQTWYGTFSRTMRLGEVGAWIDAGAATTLASVTPVLVQDASSYTDVQASIRYPSGPLDLGMTAGLRAGRGVSGVDAGTRRWASVSAVAWIASRFAVVASGGTYPADPSQGYGGGRFFSLALRLAPTGDPRPKKAAVSPGTPVETGAEARGGEPGLEVRRVSGNQRMLRVFAPSARRVEINGDFTHWQPIALVRQADGWWTAVRTIAPGTYQLNWRLDGGPWAVPPGLLATTDEFGGSAGLLTIE